MKFLCIPCDEAMTFAERRVPGDGTMATVFTCQKCGREIALLTNPMETQLVSSLGVKVGGRTVPEQPLELVRGTLADGRDDVFRDEPDEAPQPASSGEDPAAAAGGRNSGDARSRAVAWSPEATRRLQNVPAFVRGMVKRIYTDYARERGIDVITPEIMDRARSDLGLEGM